MRVEPGRTEIDLGGPSGWGPEQPWRWLWLPQMFTQDDGMNISMEEEEGRRRALTRGGVACGVEGSQPSPA